MIESSAGHAPRTTAPIFTETQRFDQWWIWVLVVGSTAVPFVFFTYVIFQQVLLGVPVGDRPMPDGMALGVWIGFGLLAAAILALFARAALVVEVLPEGLHVRYRGFGIDRLIRYGELASFAAETYSPLGEYGGWGIRGFGRNRAYNVKGNRGVRLRFLDGSQLLVGSGRADALARAMERCAGRAS